MFIPLGIAEQRRRATVVTWWLIAINAACMLAQQAVLRFAGADTYRDLIDTLGWTNFNAPWGLLTYQFLHGDLMHLAGNMLFLWVFGVAVEARIGRWKFLALYILGGFAAALAQYLQGPTPVQLSNGSTYDVWIPTIGASGSVAAVTGAFLALAPRAPMRILFFFFLIGIFSIPAWWFILFAIAKDFVFQTWASATGTSSGVAHLAHLGGYGFGFAAAMIMLARGWAERGPYNLFTMHRQARRRRQFKLAVESVERDTERAIAKTNRTRDEAAERDREALVAAVNAGDMDTAAAAYSGFLAAHPDAPLPRDPQLKLAQHLYATGDYRTAAVAFDAFVTRSPNDRETPGARIMLAVLKGRYLSNPKAALQALEAVDQARLGPDERDMHAQLQIEFTHALNNGEQP